MTLSRPVPSSFAVGQWLAVAAALTVVSIILAVTVSAVRADDAVILLLICAVAVPVAVAVAVMAARGHDPYAFAAACLLVTIQGANFRFRDAADKTIDWQVGVKLLGLALLVAVALPTVIGMFRRLPLSQLMWCSLVLYLCATAILAPDPVYSLIASSSVLATWLYLAHVARTRGAAGLISIVLVTTLLLTTASLVVYFAVPELGRMSDWVDGAFIPTSRLQGVLGSANSAGISAAFGLLLLPLVPQWRLRMRCLAGAIFFACLVLSQNRMALACTLLALTVLGLGRWRPLIRLAALALAFGLALIILDVAGDDIASSLARSGSAEEVTSLTGRTRIWAVALELISQQPLFGHGYASAQRLLPTHPMLFEAAAHTHNLYLEVLFSGGVIGLALLVTAMSASIRLAMRRRDNRVLALLTLFFVYGLTEPILSNVTSLPSFGFLAATLLAGLPSDHRGTRG